MASERSLRIGPRPPVWVEIGRLIFALPPMLDDLPRSPYLKFQIAAAQ